jgi:hypothetical protein
MPVARLPVMTTEIKLHKLSPINFAAVAELLRSSTVLLKKKKRKLTHESHYKSRAYLLIEWLVVK